MTAIDTQLWSPPSRPSRSADGLAITFGATTLMWFILYVTCMPAIAAPPALVAALVAACLLGAGIYAGVAAGRTALGGLRLGAMITAVNLIMLTSFGRGDDARGILLTTLPFIAGFLLVSCALCAGGAWIGRRMRAKRTTHSHATPTPSASSSSAAPRNWTGRFALVIAFLTLMLLQAGGVVTTLEAGMAVPDWLTTFNYPMMFYPLALMQKDGGVFAEHFHRLWGLLVGLGMIVLTVHLWRIARAERHSMVERLSEPLQAARSAASPLHERRTRIAWMSTAILLAVIIQGILGGMRVTENNLTLAIIHGVFGQIVFAAIVCVAVVTADRWRRGAPQHRDSARLDRSHSAMLVGVLIAQLVLGALYRHLQADPEMSAGALHSIIMAHILGAIAVVGLALFVGIRAATKYGSKEPVLRRFGAALVIVPAVQFALGFAAFLIVPGEARPVGETVPVAEVVIATAHQVTGSVLLAASTVMMLWMRRLIVPAPEATVSAAPLVRTAVANARRA